MKSALLLVAVILLLAIAVAQNRPTSGASPKFIAGTVEGFSGNQVYVNRGLQLVVLAVDAHTEVWKGKVFHDLSPLEAGDEVLARCRLDASGNLIAESMHLNGFHSSGVITKVTDTGFEVFTNWGADPQSGYKKENKIVEVDADTVFEESAREDLRSGRGVEVTGLDLRNGRVRATRVTVSEGNRPVRMRPGRVILPNGQIR
jgi:hypothetical protein